MLKKVPPSSKKWECRLPFCYTPVLAETGVESLFEHPAKKDIATNDKTNP
jgi:hypothetical protein